MSQLAFPGDAPDLLAVNTSTSGTRYRDRVVRERFDGIAGRYDNTILRRRHQYINAIDQIIAQRLIKYAREEDTSPLRVLDAACGTGTHWNQLKELLPATECWGLDLSSSMCQIASRQAVFTKVLCADLADIPADNEQFDAALCLFFSFCYLTTSRARHAAVREIRRVIRPGGCLIIDAINLVHLGEAHGYHRSMMGISWDIVKSCCDPRLRLGDKLYWTREPDNSRLRGYFHGFTHNSLGRLLVSEGFRIESLLTIGYHSGRTHDAHRRGQILAICRAA